MAIRRWMLKTHYLDLVTIWTTLWCWRITLSPNPHRSSTRPRSIHKCLANTLRRRTSWHSIWQIWNKPFSSLLIREKCVYSNTRGKSCNVQFGKKRWKQCSFAKLEQKSKIDFNERFERVENCSIQICLLCWIKEYLHSTLQALWMKRNKDY